MPFSSWVNVGTILSSGPHKRGDSPPWTSWFAVASSTILNMPIEELMLGHRWGA